MKEGLNHTRIVNEQKIIRGRFPLHRQKNKKNKQIPYPSQAVCERRHRRQALLVQSEAILGERN